MCTMVERWGSPSLRLINVPVEASKCEVVDTIFTKGSGFYLWAEGRRAPDGHPREFAVLMRGDQQGTDGPFYDRHYVFQKMICLYCVNQMPSVREARRWQ